MDESRRAGNGGPRCSPELAPNPDLEARPRAGAGGSTPATPSSRSNAADARQWSPARGQALVGMVVWRTDLDHVDLDHWQPEPFRRTGVGRPQSLWPSTPSLRPVHYGWLARSEVFPDD